MIRKKLLQVKLPIINVYRTKDHLRREALPSARLFGTQA